MFALGGGKSTATSIWKSVGAGGGEKIPALCALGKRGVFKKIRTRTITDKVKGLPKREGTHSGGGGSLWFG